MLATLARSSGNAALSRQAISAAIRAADYPLAVSLAKGSKPSTLALDARLLLTADALAQGKTRDALNVINEQTDDSDGGFIAPLLRAWSISDGGGNGAAMLESSGASNGPLAPSVDEQRVYLLFREGKVAEAKALATALLSKAGSSGERFRLATAEALRRAGDRAGAEAILAGKSPSTTFDLSKPAPPGIAVDTPARGFATQMFRLAAALADNRDPALPVALVQIGRLAAPDSSEGMLLLALLMERQDRPDAALEAARMVPASDPFITDAREIIARDLLKLDRGGEALALAQQGVSQGGTSGDWALLGNVLDDLNRPAESANAYAQGRALAVAQGDPRAWTFSLLRADQLEKSGNWPAAKAELRAGLALAPQEPLLLNFLGYGQLERGEDVTGSEAMIRKALELRPDDPSITDSLGWALYKRGRTDEAVDTLRKAAAADPGQWEIQEHLGDALFSTGQRMEARFAWRAALLTAEKDDKQRIERKLEIGLTPTTAAP